MAALSEILIVISIILILLSQSATLRVKHDNNYYIDIDTPFIGFSINTERGEYKEDKRKRKKQKKQSRGKHPLAYYNAISYLVSNRKVAIGRLAPSTAGETTPLTLLPTYTVIYSLLSLLINTAEEATLATRFSDVKDDGPNIDVAIRFSCLNLIISLLLLQYYGWKMKREAE